MPATSLSGDCLVLRSASERRRLTLEVQNDEVPFGPQHLSQMIVPVDAGAQRMDLACRQLTEAVEHQASAAEHQAGPFQHTIGQAGYIFLERIEGAAGVQRSALRAAGRCPVELSGSGMNAGSWVGEARARCISAVRLPSNAAASR